MYTKRYVILLAKEEKLTWLSNHGLAEKINVVFPDDADLLYVVDRLTLQLSFNF